MVPPSRSWPSTPATDTTSPEDVERKAANAPAATTRPEDSTGCPADRRAGQQQDDGIGLTGEQQLRRVEPAQGAEHRREEVERAEQADDDQRRTTGRTAVRVGVEPDQDVRQPHRAKERSEDQRVDAVERMAPGVAFERRGPRAARRTRNPSRAEQRTCANAGAPAAKSRRTACALASSTRRGPRRAARRRTADSTRTVVAARNVGKVLAVQAMLSRRGARPRAARPPAPRWRTSSASTGKPAPA